MRADIINSSCFCLNISSLEINELAGPHDRATNLLTRLGKRLNTFNFDNFKTSCKCTYCLS